MQQQEMKKQYKILLGQYMKHQTERNLYLAQNFSRHLVRRDITPEEVISMHKEVLEELELEIQTTIVGHHDLDFLIEFMIQYGFALREHKSLLKKQEDMDYELDLAANVQKTMLKTDKPTIEAVDIGYRTEPAKKMNGDYIYFNEDMNNYIGIGVADVVGKGIPAALCMSMVKNTLDTLGQPSIDPAYAIDVLNRVVEKNIKEDMFISMFYSRYNIANSTFSYASAGHEPALLYRQETDSFVELSAKGLLLGILPVSQYEEKSITLQSGDFVVIMTDGVTECRKENGEFIDEQQLYSMLSSVKHLSAQEMADYVYFELEKFLNFKLLDDITFVILKKE